MELKELDCNCNDCKCLVRDSAKLNSSKEFHKKMQLEEYDRKRLKLEKQVDEAYRKNELEAGFSMEQMLRKMKFQFNSKDYCLINFGFCNKLSKEVNFIPNTCQVDTQTCFELRS